MRLIAAALACVLVLFGAGPVLAQTSPAEKPVTQSKPATQKPAAQQPVAQKAKPAASQVVMPDAEKIVFCSGPRSSRSTTRSRPETSR
jgi:hypothetical protein